MREALFYQRMERSEVRCLLCRHRCLVPEGGRGICGVRENRGGVLYTLVYEKLISEAVDPIEKKPLYHFLPGSSAYSIATVGCNFRCDNCQNFEISQLHKGGRAIPGRRTAPEAVVESAKMHGCRSIAYTYSEPTVFYEYALDVARLASKEGVRNVFVTNGYITDEALKEISPYLDAANIDLKSFNDSFYTQNCGARLDQVLDTIRSYKRLGIWVELTTLIIPSLNDDPEELKMIAEFIRGLGSETPWHVSRFYPMYRLSHLPPTPPETLTKAREIGLEAGLRYVYEGNVPGSGGETTYCPSCRKPLISRFGYQILENLIKDSRCPGCGAEIDGVWE
ncbi:MAG: AmmeMemoRadiSam system radical SAM enzyme [Candidatus Bathyarchaeia archaeon]